MSSKRSATSTTSSCISSILTKLILQSPQRNLGVVLRFLFVVTEDFIGGRDAMEFLSFARDFVWVTFQSLSAIGRFDLRGGCGWSES